MKEAFRKYIERASYEEHVFLIESRRGRSDILAAFSQTLEIAQNSGLSIIELEGMFQNIIYQMKSEPYQKVNPSKSSDVTEIK